MTTRLFDSTSKARRLLPATLVAGALALGLPALAQAGAIPAVKVQYSKATLKHEAGARALYAKLQGAARRACGEADGRDLRMVRAVNECQDEAVANAVASIGSTMLAAVHSQETGGTRLASTGDAGLSR